MATTEINSTPPPIFSGDPNTRPMQEWFRAEQKMDSLEEVDTSAGSYEEALPAAGLNPGTGQSNQNRELTYIKTSADGHTYTLTGAITGNLTLTAQYAYFKVKSDGTNWYKVG